MKATPERLREYADYLESLPPEKIGMGQFFYWEQRFNGKVPPCCSLGHLMDKFAGGTVGSCLVLGLQEYPVQEAIGVNDSTPPPERGKRVAALLREWAKGEDGVQQTA